MAKERVRVTRQGNAYTPQRTLNYEARLAWAAQEVMAGRPPLEGPVALDLSVFMPIAVSKPKKWKAAALAGAIWPTKKPDLDNVMKIATDACNLIVWVDDAQIVESTLRKSYCDQPRIEMKVRPVGEAP